MDRSIKVSNLNFWHEKSAILKDISLFLGKNEKIAILGENGVGKSTLLKILAGILEAKEAKITILGNEIESLSDFKSIRENIGYLPQNLGSFFILPTALEDISFSLKVKGIKEAKKLSEELLKKFDLEYLKDSSIWKLSEGEKQMVALLATIIKSPKILLLDEATSFLDDKNKNRVFNFLEKYEGSVILISHEQKLPSFFKRYVLNETLEHLGS
ncbi:MAG: energy-coupling factor ABC transporter ATP-binding protein [Sulfurospirillaceae bacterium]|jgi:cobalt/nickel transport system ATP-binding protein|nr:energy-coupling factor ABC transporter ATP-binding protein [Sulfurospirillaceae bacterium]MDY0237713.1 ABC transporter ATP-binding protein [Campylobacterales bacterium]NLM99493.1 ABC transporter ATP-binding protein [Campylobacteraceae bacterium]